MSDEQQEEIRQLRTAVEQLTHLTHGLYLQLVRHDLVPIPEFSRWKGDLAPYVLDPKVRAIWENTRIEQDHEVRDAAQRQHPE